MEGSEPPFTEGGQEIVAAEADRKHGPAQEEAADHATSADHKREPWRRVELKRQWTNNGTPNETSRTTLRLEALFTGFISLLRVDIPSVDKRKDDLTYQGLGDIKVRAGFHPILLGDCRLSTFLEVILPTEETPELGSGKYQLAPGVRLIMPIEASWVRGSLTASSMEFEPLVQQYVSVGGDPSRPNINYTKVELTLKAYWQKKYWLSLISKTTIDWLQDARTGSLLEGEAGWIINRAWRVWLKYGHGFWGIDVQGMYGTQTEAGVRFSF